MISRISVSDPINLNSPSVPNNEVKASCSFPRDFFKEIIEAELQSNFKGEASFEKVKRQKRSRRCADIAAKTREKEQANIDAADEVKKTKESEKKLIQFLALIAAVKKENRANSIREKSPKRTAAHQVANEYVTDGTTGKKVRRVMGEVKGAVTKVTTMHEEYRSVIEEEPSASPSQPQSAIATCDNIISPVVPYGISTQEIAESSIQDRDTDGMEVILNVNVDIYSQEKTWIMLSNEIRRTAHSIEPRLGRHMDHHHLRYPFLTGIKQRKSWITAVHERMDFMKDQLTRFEEFHQFESRKLFDPSAMFRQRILSCEAARSSSASSPSGWLRRNAAGKWSRQPFGYELLGNSSVEATSSETNCGSSTTCSSDNDIQKSDLVSWTPFSSSLVVFEEERMEESDLVSADSIETEQGKMVTSLTRIAMGHVQRNAPYFSIASVLEKGTTRVNPKLDRPRKGDSIQQQSFGEDSAFKKPFDPETLEAESNIQILRDSANLKMKEDKRSKREVNEALSNPVKHRARANKDITAPSNEPQHKRPSCHRTSNPGTLNFAPTSRLQDYARFQGHDMVKRIDKVKEHDNCEPLKTYEEEDFSIESLNDLVSPHGITKEDVSVICGSPHISGSIDQSDSSTDIQPVAMASEAPLATLCFQMSDKSLREAMRTSSGLKAAFWSHQLYENSNGEKVIVHYCTNKQQSEECAKILANEPILGFDMEWYPHASVHSGFKRNASLIQLASEKRIALFHIAKHSEDNAEEVLAPSLRAILESPEILKSGVNVATDRTRLIRYLGCDAKGYFELSHLYKLVKHSLENPEKVNKALVSLATQVQEHLQLPLYKGEVRWSNWSGYKPLSYEQQVYAAADAYAGFRLFHVLETKRRAISPTSPRPALYELNLPITIVRNEVDESKSGEKISESREKTTTQEEIDHK